MSGNEGPGDDSEKVTPKSSDAEASAGADSGDSTTDADATGTSMATESGPLDGFAAHIPVPEDVNPDDTGGKNLSSMTARHPGTGSTSHRAHSCGTSRLKSTTTITLKGRTSALQVGSASRTCSTPRLCMSGRPRTQPWSNCSRTSGWLSAAGILALGEATQLPSRSTALLATHKRTVRSL